MNETRSRRRAPATVLARRLVAVAAPLLAVGLVAAWTPTDAAPATAVRSDRSSPAQSESSGNCAVYASGTSMGSYCNIGGSSIGTLKQRFGGMVFHPCLYKEPEGKIHVPRNPEPDKGRWWMQICQRHINWNTITGGENKQISMQLVWMPFSADTPHRPGNALERWLWDVTFDDAQFPRPYLRPKPNYVPLVGVPTYFEFSWLNPDDQQPVHEGPYASRVGHGGPFVQTRNGDMIMQAVAKRVTVNPMQEGMDAIDCGVGIPDYDQDKKPVPAQQKSECYTVFTRSSATARAKATHPIPKTLQDVYYIKVVVDWKVTYGRDLDHMQPLGGGFKMISYQPLPVQEVQAPNLPPVMIF